MTLTEEGDKEGALKNISGQFLLLADSCVAEFSGMEKLAQTCPSVNGATDAKSMSEMQIPPSNKDLLLGYLNSLPLGSQLILLSAESRFL